MRINPDILRKYRRTLMSEADEASKALIRILTKAEQDMIAQIAAKGENGVTRAQVNKVSRAIDRIVLDSRKDTAEWLEGAAPRASLNGLGTQAAYLKAAFNVTNWRDIPVVRIRETFLNWERVIQSGRVLKGTDWLVELDDYTRETLRSLQREFSQAVIQGRSWTDLAQRVSPDISKLDLAGRMNMEDFARGFTRAKLTEIANETNTKATVAAGIDLFVNIGVDDDRQSEICAEASQAEAMSLEAWEKSDFGPPPRHVLNCRCILLADVSAILEEVPELEAQAA